jgi:SAM-dependent methyltransferase
MTAIVRVMPASEGSQSYAWVRAHPNVGYETFADAACADPRMHGRVLDVGCGAHTPHIDRVHDIMKCAQQWDGVEPSPEVAHHPALTDRWHATMEDAPVPEAAYDGALAWMVLEHVAKPADFMTAVLRALKPGGVFYAGTPHRWHPFALLSRTLELLGLKDLFVKHGPSKVNDYPAYYRLNTRGAMNRACRSLGVSGIDVWYAPGIQWRQYFPSALRFGPDLYDRFVGVPVRRAAQLIYFRVTKAGDWQRPDHVDPSLALPA